MPGEQTAKFYEAFTAYALESAKRATAYRRHSVEREVELPSINIRSDVVLRSPTGVPESVFLVTHSGIEVHWAEKFKRDSAEFLEIAISDLPIDHICLVLFDARTLPGLEAIASTFLTGIIRIPDIDTKGVIHRYGHDAQLLKRLSKLDAGDTHLVIESLVCIDAALKAVTNEVASALTSVLKGVSGTQGQSNFFSLTKTLVSLRRKRHRPRAPRHTRYNRSISKLAMLEPKDVRAVSQARGFSGQYDWATLPVFWQSGRAKGPLLNRAIGNQFRCADPEINGGLVGPGRGYEVERLFDHVSVDEVLEVIGCGRQEMLPRYLARIHAMDVNQAGVEFVSNHRKELLRSNRLGDLLLEVSRSPHETFVEKCKLRPSRKITWHWLYTAIVSLMKAVGKKKQGFGYSKIAAKMKTARYRTAVEHSILQNLEYGLKELPEALIREVADSLAGYLADTDTSAVDKLAQEATHYLVWSEFEDKVIPHAVDVLPAMIELAAKRHGILLTKDYLTSCLADAIDLGGTSGRTNLYRAGDNIIWYKAGHYRQNILHKRHEMQSVISGWMQDWNAPAGRFEPTRRFQKMIIVIDGDWLPEDLELLHAFGCDEFLYPDELDQLPAVLL
jgi:hypothetical protein